MKAIFHYDVGPRLAARFAALLMPHVAWLTPETLDRNLESRWRTCDA